MRVRPAAVALLVVGIVAALLGGCGDGGDDETNAGDDSGREGAATTEESSTSSTAPQIGVVATYEDLSQEHVAVGQTVDYPQTPPVGGEHWEAWQDCGVYDEPIRTEAAVHSLEHGAVWITYRPDLPADQVDLIRAYADQPYVLVSPWEDDSLPAPIVLTAWGAQLLLEALPDPAADQFVTTYRESPDSPEPDAPCTGGIALTAAEVAEELSG